MAAKKGNGDSMANYASVAFFSPELNKIKEGLYWLKKSLMEDTMPAFQLSIHFINTNLITFKDINFTCEKYIKKLYVLIGKSMAYQKLDKAYSFFRQKKYDSSAVLLSYKNFVAYNDTINKN